MVAKSYMNLRQAGDPFSESGRMYVNVETKSGAIKKVRWYTEAEFAKMYPEAVTKPVGKTQKELFGFVNNVITIYCGYIDDEDNEYFKLSPARYNRWFGWFTTDPLEDIPEGIEPVALQWDLVGNADGSLKTDAEVQIAIDNLRYPPTDSEFQGEIGDKLDLYVTIERIIPVESIYGASNIFKMYDDCGNTFIWSTATKRDWVCGAQYHIVGTVKDHKIYRNDKETVLTRCKEV